jgi:hypothetical protein
VRRPRTRCGAADLLALRPKGRCGQALSGGARSGAGERLGGAGGRRAGTGSRRARAIDQASLSAGHDLGAFFRGQRSDQPFRHPSVRDELGIRPF